METKILNYLNKASKHLFLTENNKFFKVMPVKFGDKLHAVTIFFGEGKPDVYVIDVDKYISWYGGNALNVMQNRLFNGDGNAIKHFKAVRELLGKVEQFKVESANLDDFTAKVKKLFGDNPIAAKTAE